jgi:hypothetical protein
MFVWCTIAVARSNRPKVFRENTTVLVLPSGIEKVAVPTFVGMDFLYDPKFITITCAADAVPVQVAPEHVNGMGSVVAVATAVAAATVTTGTAAADDALAAKGAPRSMTNDTSAIRADCLIATSILHR